MQQPLNESGTSSQYRKGDWVELKRKPKIDGAYLKRGDKIQIDFVHPVNGSIRFWNSKCGEWNYLWPEDMKPCKSPAESVVETVTELNAESVVETVTELNAESVVETVTELNAESVVEIVRETQYGWLDYHYKVRIDGKQHSVRKPQKKSTGPYYTYRWQEEGRQRAKYVPSSKLNEIYRYIGVLPPNEIVKIIENPLSRLEINLNKKLRAGDH